MDELESVIKSLNKKLKIGSIQIGVEHKDVEKIPFSSYRLNYMTYGGLPLGRVAEFFGADGSGKTTTAIDLAGQAQKMYPDKKVLFCDIEHTLDYPWARKIGLDTDSMVYFDPDSMGAEDVFSTLLELINTGEISVCILDSIGALVSTQANEKEIGERTYGGVSMSLTEFAKKITPILAKTNTILIGINQVRDDMNSTYGGITTTGGRAWRHACTTRLSFRKGNYVDFDGKQLSRACENPAGNVVNVHLEKSKVCPPDRKIGFYTLKYLDGIDSVSDLFDVAVKEDVIVQSGAWFSMMYEDKEIKLQGKPKFIEHLKENPNLQEYIEKELDSRLK